MNEEVTVCAKEDDSFFYVCIQIYYKIYHNLRLHRN